MERIIMGHPSQKYCAIVEFDHDHFLARHKETSKPFSIIQLDIYDEEDFDTSVDLKAFINLKGDAHQLMVFEIFDHREEKFCWFVMEPHFPLSIICSWVLNQPTFKLPESYISAICYHILQSLLYFNNVRKFSAHNIRSKNICLLKGGAIKLIGWIAVQHPSLAQRQWPALALPIHWLPPEIIQENPTIEFKEDIWSLGITLLEFAEGREPYHEIHPLRVLFMIPSRPPPTLTDPDRRSPEIKDFLAKCLDKSVVTRANATQLLEVRVFSDIVLSFQHPFITNNTITSLEPLYQQIKTSFHIYGWQFVRFLWIGRLKEEPSYCNLALLPSELTRYISGIVQRDCIDAIDLWHENSGEEEDSVDLSPDTIIVNDFITHSDVLAMANT